MAASSVPRGHFDHSSKHQDNSTGSSAPIIDTTVSTWQANDVFKAGPSAPARRVERFLSPPAISRSSSNIDASARRTPVSPLPGCSSDAQRHRLDQASNLVQPSRHEDSPSKNAHADLAAPAKLHQPSPLTSSTAKNDRHAEFDTSKVVTPPQSSVKPVDSLSTQQLLMGSSRWQATLTLRKTGLRVAAAAGGHPGDDDIVVIHRNSDVPPRHCSIALDGTTPAQAYQRDLTTLAEQAAKAAHSANWCLEGSTIRVFVVNGSARQSPYKWHQPPLSPIYSDAGAAALMKAIPAARRVVIIGAHGLCTDLRLLSDWLRAKVDEQAKLLFTTDAGQGRPLPMTSGGLVAGIEITLSKNPMNPIVDGDVRELIRLLNIGQKRREAVSAALSYIHEHGRTTSETRRLERE